MKINNNYEEHLASKGIYIDLNMELKYLYELAENIYAMAFNANCYSHIRTLLLQQWKEHEDVLRVSGVFIHFTSNSLTTSMMMEVCKIYDLNKNSMTIYLLDEKTKLQHKNLPTPYSRSFNDIYQDIENLTERDNIICQLKDKYETRAKNGLTELSKQLFLLDSIVKNVKKQRNKLYAHNNFLSEQQEINLISEYPITLTDINTLISFALDYSTTIIASITGQNRPKTPVNITDFDGLMQYILEGYVAIQTKIKESDSGLGKL